MQVVDSGEIRKRERESLCMELFETKRCWNLENLEEEESRCKRERWDLKKFQNPSCFGDMTNFERK